jgi:hypothetical protein
MQVLKDYKNELCLQLYITWDDQSRGLSHQRSESWVVASHFLCDLINLVNLPAPNSSVEGSSISSSERSKKFFELVLLTCPGGGGGRRLVLDINRGEITCLIIKVIINIERNLFCSF